jgi:hypothetical protein
MDYNIDIVTEELAGNKGLALELHGHKNRLINRFKELQVRLENEETRVIDSTGQDEEAVQQ